MIRHTFSFFAALLCAIFTGGGIAFLFKLTGMQTIILVWLCSILSCFILWCLFFKSLSKIVNWLADGHEQAQITCLPQSGRFGELVRLLTRILRLRDQKIRQQQERLTNLFKALQIAPMGVLLLGRDERLIWGNDNAAQYFGLNFPQDYQQHMTNLVRFPEFVEYFSSMHNGAALPSLKLTSELKKSFSIQMVSDQEYDYHLLLVQDITEQEQINQIRQDFVANISHEIRTPLTVLSGFIESMQNLPLDDEDKKHYLVLMAQQSSRIHHLVNDLLTLAKLESTTLPDPEAKVEMNELFDQVKIVAQEIAVEKQYLAFSVPEGMEAVQIAGDGSEILSAMTNIVSNAVRYTPQGGVIHIGWQLNEKNDCLFFVKDNGPGIAKKHLPRLTERFYRVDKGRSQKTGGTGLGLAIVKHIMQRHNGYLEIDSSLGKGSTFTLYFPKV